MLMSGIRVERLSGIFLDIAILLKGFKYGFSLSIVEG